MFDKLIQGNIYTARNLMRAIHTSKIADVKVIHFSTMSVYGAPQYLPVDEEHPVSPVNLYGITKLAGEQMIKYYAQNYNIHSLVLRVPGVFGGKRRGGAIYNFVKNAIINENINIKTTGLKSWSTIYIDTLSTMALQLINDYKWDKLYEIINLSYGENIDIIDTANVIKQKIDSKSQVIVEQPIDYQKFWLSNEKLNNTIEQRYSYDEDLEQYIKVIRES
jgi:UDP-glucose 4-epimerase